MREKILTIKKNIRGIEELRKIAVEKGDGFKRVTVITTGAGAHFTLGKDNKYKWTGVPYIHAV